MKKKTILFALFVIVASVSAQEGIEFSPKQDSVPKFKRNEISINTAPLFKMLLGSGNSDATRYSVTYKRNLSCKSALRLSIMADKINTEAYYLGHWNETIILQTDSVLIKQSTVSPGYWSPHINIGYERHFGKHKLKWFYGGDATVGYAQNHSYVKNTMLVRDTLHGPNAWVEVLSVQADIVSIIEKKIFSLGFSPFFGAKYPISKRFSISAQVGVDMTFQNQDVSETKGGVTTKYRVSTFDFNQNTGFLNDISLVYRF